MKNRIKTPGLATTSVKNYVYNKIDFMKSFNPNKFKYIIQKQINKLKNHIELLLFFGFFVWQLVVWAPLKVCLGFLYVNLAWRLSFVPAVSPSICFILIEFFFLNLVFVF